MSDQAVNERQKEIMADINQKRKEVVRSISAKEHAQLVKSELKIKFPKIKFSVISDIFAGGDSVTVYSVGDRLSESLTNEIDRFVDKFNGYNSDLMDGRYNVEFMYNNERIRGASFCRYNGRKNATK